MTYPIQIKKTKSSRLSGTDLDNIIFGKLFSDHMLVADYYDKQWHDVRIEPYGPIQMSPAISALHYGQSIFEGMKAYKDREGNPLLFRPRDNWKRMNKSAWRMCMPEIPEDIFMEGLKKLIKLDKDWIPTKPGSALYIRPFMFATDEYVGIKPSDNYKFIIFCSPVGAYYPEPIKVLIEDYFVRACKGGVGAAKAAGNYGASLYPASIGQKKGYRQLVWTDALEHKYIEESGTMNMFFVIDGKVVTPEIDTENGTVLEGITRDSAIKIIQSKGIKVEARKVAVDEIVRAHEEGRLNEVFGTGTAATVANIESIGYKDKDMDLPPFEERKVSPMLLEELEGIRRGEIADPYGWVMKI
jgi:branched-chain amino acid aminotransferase